MWRKHNCADRVMILSGGSKVATYECTTCKCLMEKPAKFVEHIVISTKSLDAYCGKCAPPYDKVDDFHGWYLKMMRVNEDGTLWVDPMGHLNAKKSK